ncbi:MAG: prohibitin family protein [Proteobacteria bacterium]|nr:prohibitin family protein [Pseudomonadota bacterium]
MRDAVLFAVTLLTTALFLTGARVGTTLLARGCLGIAMGLLSAGLVAACWVEVPPGAVGAVYDPLAGGIQSVDLSAGWHLVRPWAHVQPWSVRTQEYTMSSKHDDGAVAGDDAMVCQTTEGLQVRIDVTVLFHIEPGDAHQLWKTVGSNYINTIVRPATREAVRTVVSQYPIMSIYSNASAVETKDGDGVVSFPGKRREVEQGIQTALAPSFESKGIRLERVLLRNVDYVSKEYEAAIVSKQVAQQQVLAQQFLLQIEKIKAQQKVVQSEGQAEAIRLRGIALRANRGVLDYEFVRRLPNDLDVTVLPGGNSVIMNLPQGAAPPPQHPGHQ